MLDSHVARGAVAGADGLVALGDQVHAEVLGTTRGVGLTGTLWTHRALNSPERPSHFVDFWDTAYAAIGT